MGRWFNPCVRGFINKKSTLAIVQTKKNPRGFFQNPSPRSEDKIEKSPGRVQTFSLPHQFSLNAIVIKIDPPLILSAWQSYMLHPILAAQLHGGNTSACNCEAGIASLALPRVNNTAQSTKTALDFGTISVIVTKCILGEEGHSHPQHQDSQLLPKTHPDMPSIRFCVSRAHATHIIHHAQSQKC